MKPPREPLRAKLRRGWQWMASVPGGLVIAIIIFNLWTLRAERLPVQHLNDNGVHISMIHWAAERFSSGHFPLDGWFPYLNLGLPQFHHYQSLPHFIMALPASVVGALAAFSWSVYLLLALWPLSVYWGARLLGWDRWQSSFAALVSPLLLSIPGFGYEYGSYTWQGLGVWSQLWGMWMLPLAWGFSWRAVRHGASFIPAGIAIALAVACNFLTGYLALLSLGVMTLINPSVLLRRVGRGAILGVGSLLIASWVIVPLIVDSPWSNRTRFAGSIGGSHGAKTVLGWLFTGGMFDGRRFPAVTLLVAFGAAICVWNFKNDERARTVLALAAVSLVLFFGRPTLGSLVNLLPGGQDLIYRRFIFGVHLAGIVLAGVGAAAIAQTFRQILAQAWEQLGPFMLRVAGVLLIAGILWPPFKERVVYHARGAQWIHEQQRADRIDGASFVRLVESAKRRGPGRIYAGTIWGTSWGDNYRIGRVPAYAALLHHGADSIGFSIRTVSLSSDIEVGFDETNPAHYDLFNVRYLILPPEREPAVPAMMLRRSGRHTLWEVATPGYVELVDTIPPPVTADRASLGAAMELFLTSPLLDKKQFPAVAFNGERAPSPTATPGTVLGGSAGSVEAEAIDLAGGNVRATVYANRRSVVLLKTTFHPRWKAVVDGVNASTQMISPSYVGVAVPRGRHRIGLWYQPYPHPWSFLLAVIGLLLLGVMGWRRGLQRLKTLAVRSKGGRRAEHEAVFEPSRSG